MLTSRAAQVKFLIVDDLEENIFAFQQVLRRDGLELIAARSGRAALEALLIHDFALALIDVHMPEMDGVELAELMRSTERTRHVPIIFVTADTHERGSPFRGYEAGAVDYLHKPIEPMVLRNKAETFFELYRQKLQLGQQLEQLGGQQRRTRALLEELAAQSDQLRRQNDALQRANVRLEQQNEELARAQAQARRAREVAEAANRAKDEFLANVSHEIRTPMNAILGMTELVLDTPLGEGQRQSLRTVRAAADSLLGSIDDLLDFSKIEAGKLELAPTPFSLRATASDTLRALAVRAHRKGLELICDVQPDVPDALIGDVGRLRQVLSNLVGNAIKFTERGEVEVDIDVADQAPDGPCRLTFAVRDTGIGISHDKQATIFQAFEQEDTSTTRKYGGTGLGLTIAARLIALMGGELSLESERGRGSRFAFSARFSCQPDAAPVPVEPAGSLSEARVLLVDDNPVLLQRLETWLRNSGLEPVAVQDGGAALTALWHGVASRQPFALALLDARMPEPDGLAIAARIRKHTEFASTRTILLTSADRPTDLDHNCEPHVDAQLAKPFIQDELLAILRSTIGGEAPPPVASPRATVRSGVAPAPAPLRVLVAEDNDFNAQLLLQLLTTRGHAVQLASTGREALQHVEGGVFDLLLLDVHMPELDGFQVIEAIRERERECASGGHLPVVAVTARSRPQDRERCLQAGMDDFLIKPISAAELWTAIERVVAGPRLPHCDPLPHDLRE